MKRLLAWLNGKLDMWVIQSFTVEIARLDLQPGDVLVLRFSHHIDADMAKRIQDMAAQSFPPGRKVLVLGPDCEISKVTEAG